MITIKIETTAVSLPVTIPTSFKELTLGQLVALSEKNPTDVECISILSHIPVEELYTCKRITDFDKFAPYVTALSKDISEYKDWTNIPSELTFKYLDGKIVNKVVKAIHNLNVEPIGAYLNCRDIVAGEINAAIAKYGEEDYKDMFCPSIKAAMSVLAHYYYCHVTGRVYSEIKAEEFIDDCKFLLAYKALPVARAFFLSYPELSIPRKSFWQMITQKSRELQESRSSRNSEQSTP